MIGHVNYRPFGASVTVARARARAGSIGRFSWNPAESCGSTPNLSVRIARNCADGYRAMIHAGAHDAKHSLGGS